MTNPNGLVLDVFQFTDQERFLELNAGRARARCSQVLERRRVGTRTVGRAAARPRAEPVPPPAAASVAPVVRCDNAVFQALHDPRYHRGRRARACSTGSAASSLMNGCDVDLVLIATEGHRAIDVFHITKAGASCPTRSSSTLTADLQRMLEERYEAH